MKKKKRVLRKQHSCGLTLKTVLYIHILITHLSIHFLKSLKGQLRSHAEFQLRIMSLK